MLKYLRITNFALIEHLELEFAPGFNLITGETGSGKSILVDSIALLVGERASQEMIRDGFNKAQIEGVFVLSIQHPAWSFLKEYGLETEENDLLIRREISRTGSNRIFINDNLSTLAVLVRLGALLADIHGQHDQQSLLQPRTHIQYLDAFGENGALLARVSGLFKDLVTLRQTRSDNRENKKQRLEKMETLRFQMNEIEQLNLKPGIDKQLEREQALLETAESRHQAALHGFQLLYDEDPSAISLMDQAHKNLKDLVSVDPNMEDVSENLLDLRYQTEEIGLQLRNYATSVQWDPNRLEEINERLSELDRAKRKYGLDLENILALLENISLELDDLESSERQDKKSSHLEENLLVSYLKLALNLSNKRHKDAKELRHRMEKTLSQLAMNNIAFRVQIKSDQSIQTGQGIDTVEFLIKPNPGEPFRSLATTASGGELSRITLALKSVVSVNAISKILVFDEVDTGIGGGVASTVGLKLARLAQQDQVFCVSHWPQLACHASRHFHVEKGTHRERTVVGIRTLSREERVSELARMTAGNAVTETTLKQARELLEKASHDTGFELYSDPSMSVSN